MTLYTSIRYVRSIHNQGLRCVRVHVLHSAPSGYRAASRTVAGVGGRGSEVLEMYNTFFLLSTFFNILEIMSFKPPEFSFSVIFSFNLCLNEVNRLNKWLVWRGGGLPFLG